jgi:hypothetical protein
MAVMLMVMMTVGWVVMFAGPRAQGTHKVCDECYALIGGPMSPRGSNNARAKDQKSACAPFRRTHSLAAPGEPLVH